MHYLFASKSLGPQTQLLAQIAATIGDGGELEAFRDVEHFSARLHRHNGPAIVILLAANGEDLARLSDERSAFLWADVVLLVPDQAADTIATAHLLRPSFLGGTDSDLDKIVPVLKRLLEKRKRKLELERGPAI